MEEYERIKTIKRSYHEDLKITSLKELVNIATVNNLNIFKNISFYW